MEKVGNRRMCTRAVELQGPVRRGVKRTATGVHCWCTTVATRFSLKGSKLQAAEFNSLEKGQIRPIAENWYSQESCGERWQAQLDPNKSQSQCWESFGPQGS